MERDIIWLASYPKSGNTWLRLFLQSYHTGAPPDINRVTVCHSDRAAHYYQMATPVPLSDMDAWEFAYLRGAALFNQQKMVPVDPLLMKTHCGNIVVAGNRLIPPLMTRKVVYLVRDPRDVLVSASKHFGKSIDDTITTMTTEGVILQESGKDYVVPHWPCSWARHVKSYAEASDLKVTVVKYEDLRKDPQKYFSWIVKWISDEVDEDRVAQAIEYTSLDRLRKQEDEKGFREASKQTERFFGKGKVAGWEDVLTPDQVSRIEAHAGNVMEGFGYGLQETQRRRSA